MRERLGEARLGLDGISTVELACMKWRAGSARACWLPLLFSRNMPVCVKSRVDLACACWVLLLLSRTIRVRRAGIIVQQG